MEASSSFVFDLVLNSIGVDHIFLILYILNVIFSALAYKLGFARKLPIGKNIIVYILLAIGNYILTIFSIFRLPITESLIIISVVLGIYRYRLYKERSRKKQLS